MNRIDFIFDRNSGQAPNILARGTCRTPVESFRFEKEVELTADLRLYTSTVLRR
jgi:hypothetical protein